MKALSLLQPWAHLVIYGGKDIENRTWRTTFRGRVAIHASQRHAMSEYFSASDLINTRSIGAETPNEVTYGAVIGTVEIVDCINHSDSPWFCGPYGFVLRNPQPLAKPVFCRGSLGLWDWEPPI